MNAPRACARCPWRLSNQGTPHPHGFYDAANLKRLWDGLRTGDAPGMTCHPTDNRMAEFSGYESTAELGEAAECAGSIILLFREVMRFQGIVFEVERDRAAGVKTTPLEAFNRYRREQPKGLKRDTIAAVAWRSILGDSPFTRAFKIDPRGLNDPDVGYKPVPWDPALLDRAQRKPVAW